MGRILSAFLMLGISSMCGAQIYKYLGIEDGLSNRRIYRIQKDGRGYMWFLTQEGMDRYDGKRIRHYTVLDGNLKVAPQVNLNWLYTDTENTLWVVGRKGRIFHYDTLHDRFRMVYRIPGLQDDFATGMLCYAYMDRGDRIWLCQGDHIIRYDTRTGIAQRLVSRLRGDITAISETDGTNLFIGTVNGLFPVRERDGVLEGLRTRTASGRRSANSTTTPVRRNCSWEPSGRAYLYTECPQAVRCGMWPSTGSPLSMTGSC